MQFNFPTKPFEDKEQDLYSYSLIRQEMDAADTETGNQPGDIIGGALQPFDDARSKKIMAFANELEKGGLAHIKKMTGDSVDFVVLRDSAFPKIDYLVQKYGLLPTDQAKQTKQQRQKQDQQKTLEFQRQNQLAAQQQLGIGPTTMQQQQMQQQQMQQQGGGMGAMMQQMMGGGQPQQQKINPQDPTARDQDPRSQGMLAMQKKMVQGGLTPVKRPDAKGLGIQQQAEVPRFEATIIFKGPYHLKGEEIVKSIRNQFKMLFGGASNKADGTFTMDLSFQDQETANDVLGYIQKRHSSEIIDIITSRVNTNIPGYGRFKQDQQKQGQQMARFDPRSALGEEHARRCSIFNTALRNLGKDNFVIGEEIGTRKGTPYRGPYRPPYNYPPITWDKPPMDAPWKEWWAWWNYHNMFGDHDNDGIPNFRDPDHPVYGPNVPPDGGEPELPPDLPPAFLQANMMSEPTLHPSGDPTLPPSGDGIGNVADPTLPPSVDGGFPIAPTPVEAEFDNDPFTPPGDDDDDDSSNPFDFPDDGPIFPEDPREYDPDTWQDSDGDGVPDWFELLLGSNPYDPNDYPIRDGKKFTPISIKDPSEPFFLPFKPDDVKPALPSDIPQRPGGPDFGGQVPPLLNADNWLVQLLYQLLAEGIITLSFFGRIVQAIIDGKDIIEIIKMIDGAIRDYREPEPGSPENPEGPVGVGNPFLTPFGQPIRPDLPYVPAPGNPFPFHTNPPGGGRPTPGGPQP